jgi:hypothetical protein
MHISIQQVNNNTFYPLSPPPPAHNYTWGRGGPGDRSRQIERQHIMGCPAPPPLTPITAWSSTGVGQATQAAFQPADLAKHDNVGTGRLQVGPPKTINRVMGVQALDKVPIRAMSLQANTSSVGLRCTRVVPCADDITLCTCACQSSRSRGG